MPAPTERELKEQSREMIVRIDERTESIIRELKDQNSHLVKINGTIGELRQMSMSLVTTIYGKESDKGLCGDVTTAKKAISQQQKVTWGLIAILLATNGVSLAQAQGLISLF